ncbi:MAG TPA: hypothetical protein PLL64_00935 [Rhodothermales bacterium]|nr:hypothetical protein [Rhodothermales bacterium]HRR09947.1 hypothetical protein [Rhodothermales bacterium]
MFLRFISWLGVGFMAVLIAACNGLQPSVLEPTSERMAEEASQIVTIKPISPDAASAYRVGPAPVDTVQVQAEEASNQGAAVEVLVKGYLADGCTELHEVAQARDSATIRVDLLVRRKTQVMCTMAVRPYKFYLKLNDRLASGVYQLALNNQVYPFRVN